MSDLLEITVQGQPVIEDYIRRFEKKLDVSHVLDEASALMFARNRARFLAQIDPDGIPWVQSQAAILRQRRGLGGGTLYASGTLFHSLQLFADDADTRSIGTDVPYGKFHQFGTITLPQRQFLGFGEEDVELAQALVQLRITEVLA